VTYGNGVAFSLAAARVLADQHRIFARVLDLRWICPLPATDILAHARATGRVLVVDECRQSGNPSEAIAALLLDGGRALAFRRVTGADSFIPLGEAADRVLLNEQEIVEAALSLMSGAESPGA
jgi:2-oxoisovalerate dehydrogenase E1 component